MNSLPHIDTIPPQLCTAKQAAEILGLRRNLSIAQLKQPKYQGIRFAKVYYNKNHYLLYNREEIKALARKLAQQNNTLPTNPPPSKVQSTK